MEVFLWIGGLLVAVLVSLMIIVLASGGPRSELEKQMQEEQDFDIHDLYATNCGPSSIAALGSERPSGIAIDKGRGEILLAEIFFDPKRPPEERFARRNRRFRSSSIIGCEVLQDNVQIAYANRGSQAVGVVVGGALLGGVGALIGGLSGSRRTEDNVKKIVLRITVDDFDYPHHDVVVGDWTNLGTGISRHDERYKKALETAQLWHARISSLMRLEQQASSADTTQPKSESVIDDLERLAGLRDRGMLDDEEFKREKRRLLGRPEKD